MHCLVHNIATVTATKDAFDNQFSNHTLLSFLSTLQHCTTQMVVMKWSEITLWWANWSDNYSPSVVSHHPSFSVPFSLCLPSTELKWIEWNIEMAVSLSCRPRLTSPSSVGGLFDVNSNKLRFTFLMFPGLVVLFLSIFFALWYYYCSVWRLFVYSLF